MKKVTLLRLVLLNFKGIRDLDIRFDGKNADVFGANRSGKSSLFDAYIWLLFGKDQYDRKDHEIKTLDANNKAIEKIDHWVEGWFDVDGNIENPKRVYKEIWRRERGEQVPTFRGHEVVYFWNEVPIKASEYQAKISSIIDESMFKLLTNTLFFNSLPWQQRRAVLLDMAGKIEDNEIFDRLTRTGDYAPGDKFFSGLINALNQKKTAVDHKKEIANKKNRLAKELQDITPRIKEVNLGRPQSYDFAALEAELVEREALHLELDNQLTSVNGAIESKSKGLKEKNKKLNQLNNDLSNLRIQIQNKVIEEHGAGGNALQLAENAVKSVQNVIRQKEQEVIAAQSHLDSLNSFIATNKTRLDAIKEKYIAENSRQFVFDDKNSVCPTCQQPLPDSDLEVKKQELLGNFNIAKQEKLTELTNEGKSIAPLQKDYVTRAAAKETEIADLKQAIKDLNETLPPLQAKLNTAKLVAAKAAEFDLQKEVDEKMTSDERAIQLRAQIKDLEEQIQKETEEDGAPDNSAELKLQRDDIKTEIDELKNKLKNKELIDKADTRLKELEDQEQKLSQEIADLEQTEFAIEKYTRAKMDILESRINHRFKFVTFKMFDRQINQAEVEACECLINGVPFSVANTESKTNAGLDIINVLCDHYKVSAPVFIDNRESVTNIIPTTSQIINLIVSPEDKELRVVVG